VGGGSVFFVDYAVAQGQAPAEAPRRCRVVALDVDSGNQLWRNEVDISDCIVQSRYMDKVSGSGGEINLIYKDGVLLLSAFPFASKGARPPSETDLQRRTIALSAADGRVLWSKRTGHLSQPVVVNGTLYAEPWAFDLQTGRQLREPGSPSGASSFWFLRTGGCGPMAASASALFFRKGSIAWSDLLGTGLHTFKGVRPGCGMNIMPANGLVLIPDGSEGCECAYPIKCSLALYRKTGAQGDGANAGAVPYNP
jgi:hypothetical protein